MILLVSAGGAFPTAVIATEVVDAAPANGYRGIWYSVGRTGDEYRYKYSGGLGTYCAKHAPFAVHRAEVGKTFFVYGGAASGTTDRLVHMVGCYDHQTGLVARPRLLLDKQTGDAHDNPVLSVDDEGHLWVFSTSHGRGRPSFIHKSVEPHAIDRFERIDAVYGGAGGETPLDNFSYVQAWRRPAGGFAAFFTHYQDPADRTSMFMTSEDGRRWSAWTRLAAIEKGHYQISAARDGLLAAAFNYHPRSGGLDSRTNLYYLQTPDSGHSWQTADGQPVDTPVTSPNSPCLVHDFASEGRNVYLKDIRLDGAGRPLILVVTSGGHAPGPTNDPRTWELFRWTGDAWRRSVVARSDNNYDMGSLYLEDGRLRVIAPTLPGPQAYNPGGEIAMHVSTDGGQAWRLERRLTDGSEHNHGYVRRPVDAAADFYALWADGHGRQPSESRLYFCTQAGEVFRLPTTMDSAWARPQPVTAPPADARP
ncbi:BNR-4 repeat-containing protein [Posidoniimonas corsicana]|nr:BNR-4 repeat-containing protein [Posidoniimonas corsicana]